jgi:hypothetical protein
MHLDFQNQAKQNFRARLVACGCSQVQDVDFSESYDQGVNNMRFCVMLIDYLIYGLKQQLLILEQRFYMEIYRTKST